MTTRRDIFNKLNETKKLPSPSGTTLEIMRLCRNETISLNDIAQVIQTDPALSAELLKYANAAFLATGIQVASIQKATVKLGMKTVVNLALGFSLLSHNKQGQCRSFDYEKFWSAALFQAIAAKAIAGIGKEFDPEEIFICALLSRMGELALATLFPEQYADILAVNPSQPIRQTMEKDEFQIASPELTLELFLSWGLPAHYALAAGFHDDPDYAELGVGSTQKIAELLNLSHRIADICHSALPTPELLDSVAETARKFAIDGENFPSFFDAIIAQWHDLGEILKIRTRECQRYDEIMAGKHEES